jgi:hypothetical protein
MRRTLFFIFFLFLAVGRAQFSPEMQKNAFKVLQEQNNIIAISAVNLPKGQRILFVRNVPDLGEFEVIGQGTIERANNKICVVKLNTDTLKKIPLAGDFAVLLGEPKTFVEQAHTKPQSDLSLHQDIPQEPEKGYLDIGTLVGSGKLIGKSGNQANSLKNIDKFLINGIRFDWYPDFFSNYGITYQTRSAQVPITSYFLKSETGTFVNSTFRLNYRAIRSLKNLRWIFFLENQSEEFNTSNSDEYVFASRYNSMGLGGHLAWEPGDLLFSTPGLLGQMNRFYLEAMYAPVLSAADHTISRGTSSTGSSRLEYSVGYTHLFYWSSIPWLKRYFLDFKYSVSDLKLQFSGNTKSEAGGIYAIPENGHYAETKTSLQITFGWRFEDLLGRNFKPR